MRRGIFGGVGLIILVIIAIAVYLSVFIVSQTEQALVLRFGRVVRQVQEPGLYYKLPLVDNVVTMDNRILDLDSPPLEIIASDQKRLVVDAWGRYRIIDPLLFFQSVGSIAVADSRLSTFVNSAVRQVLGEATFIQLVRDERAELMSRITARVDREARGLGIEMLEVMIRRADLPEANSQAIYQRMQTEREQEATQIRALGEQQARRIRAEADRTATVIVAEAQRESDETRGGGEAERNRILAGAFNADPGFFAFYRSMEAYQVGLGNTDTRWVISPDSEFFRYFADPLNAAELPATPMPPPGPATEATPPEAPEILTPIPPEPETPEGTPELALPPEEPSEAQPLVVPPETPEELGLTGPTVPDLTETPPAETPPAPPAEGEPAPVTAE
ncbi:MAG: protease modulator HflC [Rhizobiales bacterium]|nr:protease modulator HflC [Hyphomicrobiales bacterium]